MRKLHLRHVHVHLVCDEHQDAGRGAVTELRLAVRDRDRVVGVQRDPRVDLRLIRQEVGRGALGIRCVPVGRLRLAGGARESTEADDERTATLDEGLAGKFLFVHEARHGYFPPLAITAAACLIAVRMRG